MINVLVTGTGGTTGQSIIKAIHISGLNCRIVGVDANPYSAGIYRADAGYLSSACNTPEYLEDMIRIIKAESVDIVLIGSTPEVPVLARLADKIQYRTGAKVVVSDTHTVDHCFDKLLTCKWLLSQGLPCPRFCEQDSFDSALEFARDIGFPVVVKPRKGMASKGFHIVHDEDELRKAINTIQEPIIQELLLPEQEEYTCGLFYDRSAAYKGMIVLKRELKAGETYRSVVEPFEEIKMQLMPVAKALKARGGINVQLRLTSQGIRIFEINPRFSSSTSIMAYFGFNAPEAAIKSYLFEDELGEMNHRCGVALRYTDEVYVDHEQIGSLISQGYLRSPRSCKCNYL